MFAVIKIGGDLLKEGFPQTLVDELKELKAEHQFILVHGGGDIVTKISEKLGNPPKFVTSPRGFKSRYTDKDTAEIFTMVMAGKINKEIISTLQKSGIPALGLSGLDGGLVTAKRKEQLIIVDNRGRKMLIDGGYTGQVIDINKKLLNLLLENGYLPVLSAVAMGEESEPLNVDGDRLAAKIAVKCRVDKLILLTDVEGVYREGKQLKELHLSEAKALVKEMGPGMVTKVYAAVEALEGGVQQVVISSGLTSDAIKSGLENRKGTVLKV